VAEITVFYQGPCVTRTEAKDRALKYYFTGTPCCHGHIAQRWTVSQRCCRCGTISQQPGWRPSKRERFAGPPVVYHTGDVISRNDAVALGMTYYFTGLPCPNGHIDQHRVINRHCLVCDRNRKAAYYYNNQDTITDYGHQYYIANSQTIKAKVKQWREQNPDRRRVHGETRRARKASTLGEFTAADLAKLRALQKKCHICGKRFTKCDPATIDHIIPLARGGVHNASNIALAHRDCNSSKGAKRVHLI
jgi:5-methylcytosine-specific restriction endonuclease McrA